MKIHRIYAMVLRHIFVFRHSYDQWSDVFYWPTIDLILWGLTSTYFQSFLSSSGISNFILMIITGLLLWIFVWRSQHEINLCILEELWNKNFINLFVSPLTISELAVASVIIGVIKAVAGFTFVGVLAIFFYKITIFTHLLMLLPFIGILVICGWSIGFFIAGIILRGGTKVQTLAWSTVSLLSPFSAIYYPLSTLPSWAQGIAKIIPTSYMFEGAREVVLHSTVDVSKLAMGFGLSCIYLALALLFFKKSFDKTLEKGLVKVF